MCNKTDLTTPRCRWCANDPLLIQYHDEEWGRYAQDDQEHRFFEKMCLEIFQAGLSWRTILYKREAFRNAFADFDVETIAQFTEEKVANLLSDKGIVRNRMKIEAVIYNAQEVLRIRKEFDSFAMYLNQLPKDLSAVQKEFKKRFRFMGPTVTESFLQTVGKIPIPHEPQCFMYDEQRR